MKPLLSGDCSYFCLLALDTADQDSIFGPLTDKLAQTVITIFVVIRASKSLLLPASALIEAVTFTAAPLVVTSVAALVLVSPTFSAALWRFVLTSSTFMLEPLAFFASDSQSLSTPVFAVICELV